MREIFLTLLSGLFTILNPQETILSIKTNSSEIKGRMLNSIYQHEKTQFDKLVSTLNLNVLEYYNLKNLYNTDSKREAYTVSEAYKTKYSELNELRSQMISSAYYLDFEPDYYDERSIAIKYNPDARNFSVSNDVSFSSFYDEEGYIQFDQILFRCPAGITVNKKNVNYACVDVIEETISFEIDNDLLVPKIEENKNYLRLLFIFNFTGTVPSKTKTANLISSDYYLITDLQKAIVYNSKTGEIYFTYK